MGNTIKGFKVNGATIKYDFNALENAPNVQPDKTLSISDRPADAKTVGDRITQLTAAVGTPLKASTVAGMTNTDKIYVYTGSETGYTNGNWYYYDSTQNSWVSGGVYNSVAIDTDDTLSITGKPADAKKTGDEITGLKSALNDVESVVLTRETSPNMFAPTSIRLYPANGTAVLDEDGSITLNVTANNTNLWIYAEEGFSLPAGDYTLCMDDDLYVYGSSVFAIQSNASGTYQSIVTANTNKYHFTLSEATTGNLRIAFNFGANYPTFPITWTGHFWINSGDSEEYSTPGEETTIPKEFIETNQGTENAGKVLMIDDNGDITPETLEIEGDVSKTIYKYGNLLDINSVEKGYIKENGDVQPYNTLWCSNYCPVKPGYVFTVGAQYGQYFAFYNANKGLVASYATLGRMDKLTATIFYKEVPQGAEYFRCTYGYDPAETPGLWVSNIAEKPEESDVYNVETVFPYTMNPTNPCDYSELTVRAFSKVVCIGDSLTFGGFNMSDDGSSTGETQSPAELALRYSYPSNFERITGIETVNAGDSGETSVSWYNSHSSDDFSSYDLAIIHLGVNDSAFGVSDADTLSAMQNIVTMLKNARSNMRIAICSVIPAYDGVGYQAKGQLILNWAKSLNDPDIIPLDIAAYSHVRPKTSYTAGHMSALGYYMMALDIARYISWYMDQHKRDFRFIQFIGSPDASWTND